MHEQAAEERELRRDATDDDRAPVRDDEHDGGIGEGPLF